MSIIRGIQNPFGHGANQFIPVEHAFCSGIESDELTHRSLVGNSKAGMVYCPKYWGVEKHEIDIAKGK